VRAHKITGLWNSDNFVTLILKQLLENKHLKENLGNLFSMQELNNVLIFPDGNLFCNYKFRQRVQGLPRHWKSALRDLREIS